MRQGPVRWAVGYGTLEYWTGASWHWFGQARDRDCGLNGTCDEFVGASVPADRWIKFNGVRGQVHRGFRLGVLGLPGTPELRRRRILVAV